MSDARVKAEKSAFKDIKQGVVDQKPVSGKKKKVKKKFFFDETLSFFSRQFTYTRGFPTEDAMLKAIKHAKRRGYVVTNINPESCAKKVE